MLRCPGNGLGRGSGGWGCNCTETPMPSSFYPFPPATACPSPLLLGLAVPFRRHQPGPALSPGLNRPCLSVSSRAVATASHLREGVVCPEPLKVWEGLGLPSPLWLLGGCAPTPGATSSGKHWLMRGQNTAASEPRFPWPASLSQEGSVACSRDGSRVTKAATCTGPVPATP